MRRCHICRNQWADDIEVCPKDQVPLVLTPLAARLHVDPLGCYYAGSPGIDAMESTLRGLEEVLAVTPTHIAAAGLKDQIEKTLPDFQMRADALFTDAEKRFATGDLVGCLDILITGSGLRRHQ